MTTLPMVRLGLSWRSRDPVSPECYTPERLAGDLAAHPRSLDRSSAFEKEGR